MEGLKGDEMYAAESVLIGRDPWELLAEAIVVSAARDLRYAYKRINYLDKKKEELTILLEAAYNLQKVAEVDKLNYQLKGLKDSYSRAKGTMISCENFFRGGWFDTLVMHEISGEGIIEKLRKETGYGTSSS